jgi:UDP-N-acetylglucosamine transferase subunit ALG13
VTAIVGTVGTDHHPFPRFLDWVDAAHRALGFDALVQRGATPPHPGLETVEFTGALDLEAMVATADVVVCHGGPGTISLAQRCGHRPIVIARDPALGEHVDDHQQRYARRLAAEGSIELPQDITEFVTVVSALATAPRRARRPACSPTEAADRFGALVAQLVEGALPRRRIRERVLLRRAL